VRVPHNQLGSAPRRNGLRPALTGLRPSGVEPCLRSYCPPRLKNGARSKRRRASRRVLRRVRRLSSMRFSYARARRGDPADAVAPDARGGTRPGSVGLTGSTVTRTAACRLQCPGASTHSHVPRPGNTTPLVDHTIAYGVSRWQSCSPIGRPWSDVFDDRLRPRDDPGDIGILARRSPRRGVGGLVFLARLALQILLLLALLASTFLLTLPKCSLSCQGRCSFRSNSPHCCKHSCDRFPVE